MRKGIVAKGVCIHENTIIHKAVAAIWKVGVPKNIVTTVLITYFLSNKKIDNSNLPICIGNALTFCIIYCPISWNVIYIL